MIDEPSSGGAGARWAARPALALTIRLLLLIAPLLVGLGVAFLLATMLPSPEIGTLWVVRWALIAALAVLMAAASEQVFRRLLPLAALLELGLGFPESAPSRLRIAAAAARRAVGARARGMFPDGFSGDPSYDAEQLLELVAASAQSGPQSRTHGDRVRVLAVMLARELGLPQPSIDHMQWAMLLREFGTPTPYALNDQDGSPAEVVRWSGIAGWLGPWKTLLRPLTHAIGLAATAEVLAGQRLLAVADVYVVLTAAHPYRRTLGARGARAQLRVRAGSQLDDDVVETLLALPPTRLHLAIGALPSPRLLLRWMPTPRPVVGLVLGSLVGTVVFMITGFPRPPDAEVAAEPSPVTDFGGGAVSSEPFSFGLADPLVTASPTPAEAEPSESGSLANSLSGTFDELTPATSVGGQGTITASGGSSAPTAGSSSTSPSSDPSTGSGGSSPSSSPSPSPSPSPSSSPSSSPSPSPSSSPSPSPSPSPSEEPSSEEEEEPPPVPEDPLATEPAP